MALTPGTKLGPYEIQSSLGAGGMGEVYRATDSKLGRDIALKVLPAEMAHDQERLARFRREAKSLAQLDHPNIVTIHSVEESDGVHFLTMQLVEGQSLDRVIPAGGLPLEQLVEIASALGDALAAAHEKGIVHRDLKPGNVMVSSEGRVKVLDFGLAKDVRTANAGDATMTSASQTQVGVVMGTPAYMSPEQTSGRPLDHRTDIFSLGVVLHEMATGQRPFEGNSSAELVSAILRDAAPSVTDVRPDLPSDLARIIRRCLEKDPRHRLQTARDVSNEFRDLARQTFQKLVPAKTSTTRTTAVADSGGVRASEGFWVAVLPFRYRGSNPEFAAFAEGLTEDVLTGLSRFSYLKVIARSSTARYANEVVDIRVAGKELGARYVMEGSLRQAETKLRLAVQLVDASTGAHLWAETYERTFSPAAIFEMQDELVARIVSTVADMNGVLPRSMSEAVRSKTTDQLSPYEAVLRSFAYPQRGTPEELSTARSALEAALRKAPAYADAWAMLSFLSGQDYLHGFELQADAYESAASAARRAVELAPSNHLGYFSLAQSLWYQKDYDSFRDAADRAVTLNPMDGNSVAFMGELLTYTGSVERGMALATRAKQLNPNHPGWYWCADFYQAFYAGDYHKALSFGQKAKLQGFPLAPMFIATACGHLGDVEGGAKAVADLVKFRPELPAIMRKQVAKVWSPDYGERFLEGLRKAGMEIPAAGVSTVQKSPAQPSSSAFRSGAASDSGASRAGEGFWVAVLPFRRASGDADLEVLADGLTEDVTTGLSRFPYLQVIAHNSAMVYKGRAADIRTVGRELGARYAIEGSIRKRGTAVRVSAQLMDAVSGTQLWAETYDRDIGDASTFQIQDDLTDQIVTCVADGYGVLVRSMAAPTRDRKVEELSASELVLRYYAFMQQVNIQEHAALRAGFERVLQREPNYAIAWACLSNLYVLEYGDGFNPLEKPMERAQEAAWRAVKIDPACQMGWKLVSVVNFFSRDFAAFRETAERAMALNPRDGTTLAYVGIMMAYSGDWERGVALVQRAMDLNRHHPGWYYNASWAHHYRQGEYEAALLAAKKINMPEYHWFHIATAAAAGMLGRDEEARTAIESLRKYNPTFLDLENIREEIARWDPDDDEVERLMRGLEKAGLKYGTKPGSADSAAEIEPKQKSDPAAVKSVSIATATASGAARADEGFWVAVLPFKYSGANGEIKALAEGLSEEVITGLSRFSYLRVIARGSTAKYSSESGDIRAIGKELGARYVMEGSLRQAGNQLRLAVQLVDATTGAHLWAENYERTYTAEHTFALQDDLVPRIVATVADQSGILPRSMSEVVRRKNENQLTPHEAVLRAFSYFERINAEEHATVRRILEHAVEVAPEQADCWAMLSMLYRGEYAQGFNAQPDPLGRALAAAQRAVDIAPSNHLAYYAQATTLFFQKDRFAFRVAAERALALNRMDGTSIAFLGMLMAYSGEWERGCALVESAMQLNPNHPGWYRVATFVNAYNKGAYREALEAALRINMPGYFHFQAALAASAGQLGERETAQKAVRDLLALKPDFSNEARHEYEKWYSQELVEHLLDGLRKAGLEIANATGNSTAMKISDSGAIRAEQGFWVAVLPFRHVGNNAELTALADGLTEDIITGLSRFSYLRVIARSSTSRYANQAVDIRDAGRQLGARYVMEGSLRQAGSKLRLAVQLVDAVSGSHLWAENFERTFAPEAVFALQDELVPRIVSTVADAHGILPHTLGESIRGKNPEQLTPYEAVLRGFSYAERISPEEHAIARAALERAVEVAPNYAYAWAMLSLTIVAEIESGFNPKPDALERILKTARRAVELDPSGHRSYHALALAHFCRKEIPAFRIAADRAIALNPMDGCNIAHLGSYIAYAGEWEKGCTLVERALQLNPNHPGWFWFPLSINAYRKRDYEAALGYALKINLPNFLWTHTMLATIYGQLGRQEEAAKAVQELLNLSPQAAKIVPLAWRSRYDPEIVEHMIDGLRKAGLEIPET